MGKVLNIFKSGASAQARAAKKANELYETQMKKQEEELNKANAKEPDIDTIQTENAQGISSTMLSGVGGVSDDELTSNKKRKTLLGD